MDAGRNSRRSGVMTRRKVTIELKHPGAISPAMIGPDRKFESRAEVIRSLEVGQHVTFTTTGYTHAAGIRSSAYCVGASIRGRFACERVAEDLVKVMRLS